MNKNDQPFTAEDAAKEWFEEYQSGDYEPAELETLTALFQKACEQVSREAVAKSGDMQATIDFHERHVEVLKNKLAKARIGRHKS